MASIDNIRDLEFFQLVAELGSFTDAAAAARVSQPTVSQAVKRLERRLGATLIERRRFGAGGEATLTPAGLALIRHTATILDEINRLPDEIARAGRRNAPADGDPAVTYSVGLPPIISAYLLGDETIDALAHTLSGELDGEVTVQSVGSRRLLDAIERHTVDFGAVAAVESSPSFGVARTFRIASFPFGLAYAKAGAAATALAGRMTFDLSDGKAMKGMRFVTLSDDFVHSKAAGAFIRSRIDPTDIIEVADVGTMKSIIASGIAVGLMASVAVEGDGRIAFMPVTGATLPTFDVYVFDDTSSHPDARRRRDGADAFLDVIGRRLAG